MRGTRRRVTALGSFGVLPVLVAALAGCGDGSPIEIGGPPRCDDPIDEPAKVRTYRPARVASEELLVRTGEVICRRAAALGGDAKLTLTAEGRLELTTPRSLEPFARELVSRRGLRFYDWEPNVIPRDPDARDATERPFHALIDAVRRAARRKAECVGCRAGGPTYYLFDAESERPIAGPSPARAELFVAAGPRTPSPDEGLVIEVPRGTIVVEAEGPSTDAADAPPRYFVIRAIILDFAVVSRPIIDPGENPEGIDGRTGAQISGGFTIEEAERLAAFLEVEPIPLQLILEDLRVASD